jgi:hypothetical protein
MSDVVGMAVKLFIASSLSVFLSSCCQMMGMTHLEANSDQPIPRW